MALKFLQIGNQPILAKLALPACIALLSFGAVIFMAWIGFVRLDRTAELALGLHTPALRYILQAQLGLANEALAEEHAIEDSQAGQPTAADEQEFSKAAANITESVDVVSQSLDSAAYRKLLDDFKAAVMTHEGVAREILAAAHAGNAAQARELAQSRGRATRAAALKPAATLAGKLQSRLTTAVDTIGDGIVTTREQLLSVVGLGLLFSLSSLFWIGVFQVARPVRRLTSQLAQIIAGDLAVLISGTRRGDEVGALARNLTILRDNTAHARMLEEAARSHAQQAAEHMRLQYETESFKQSVGALLAELGGAADGLRQVAATMDSAAGRTSTHAAATAQDAAQSSTTLVATAASVEQMSGSIAEISRQVAQATAEARGAVDQARTTDRRIAEFVESVARIDDIVHLIAEIASRTNLLALNATIEAARAGAAGKGFAVVAGEVKSLAGQTAQATSQITGQITAIHAAMEQAVAATREAGASIGRIEGIATLIAAAVDTQSTTMHDIVERLRQISDSTARVSEAMGEVTQLAQATNQDCGAVHTASEAVTRAAAALRTAIGGFISASSAVLQAEAA